MNHVYDNSVLPSPLHVLVVEDVLSDFNLILRFLRKAGLDVVAMRVETGEELRTQLAARPWDVVLADVNLPAFGAREALLICQELGMQIPFIVISGVIDEEQAVDFIKAGAHDFVTKQNLFRLIIAIERELKAMERHRQHHQAELDLKASEEQFRSVAESAGDAIITANQSGLITFWNRGAERLFGYAAWEIMGQPITILIPERYHDLHVKGVQALVAGGQPRLSGRVVELAALRVDGREFPVEITLSMWKVRGLLYFAAIIRDVTERRQILISLQDTLKVAQDASCAKSEFLAAMSHEIRTPMNVVLGMSEMLLETDLTPEQRRFAQIMHHSGKALLGVINDILDFSRIEAGRLSLSEVVFAPRDVVKEAVQLMRVLAQGKGLSLTERMADDLPEVVVGDDGRLRQILINLLGNAIKFTHQGRVDLCLMLHPEEPDIMLFKVVDTGIGIAQEKLKHIFEQFTQADAGINRRYGGTGLGLAISRRLVNLMGGRIWVESQLGQGSMFCFTLPVKRAEVALGSVVSDALNAETLVSRFRILLADDQEMNQILQDEVVQQTAYQLVVAHDGQEVIARVQVEPFDLLILDIHMAKMDGYAVARWIRQWEREMQRPPVPIIALSAYAREGEESLSREAGCNYYLFKPLRKKSVLNLIQQIARQRMVVSESRPLRILLAEDTEENQVLMQAYLMQTGYHLEIVNDGVEAVARIQNDLFDVVVMDVQMPIMDGYTATRHIRQWEKEMGRCPVPIVALTAHALEEEMQRSLEAGCTLYLSKPINKKKLLDVLQQLEKRALVTI